MAPSTSYASSVRLAVLAAVISLQMKWLQLLNDRVPHPYLDEVFHIPQAQAYWAGRWSHWDDKITTPPGLYLWSYIFCTVQRITAAEPLDTVTVAELRFSNAFLLDALLVTLYIWAAVAKKPVNVEAAMQREIAMLGVPLLAFFSGLYYTDLFSAWTVVLTMTAWEAGRRYDGWMKAMYQSGHFLLGLLALASRQTNIFWVAVFLGGMQLVVVVQSRTAANVLRNPEVSVAMFEDIFHFALQLIRAAISHLPGLILALWPQLALLASFAAFVAWNGGVVLGDKSNHIATIHLPQLLYIWPCIVFFSWPVLLHKVQSIKQIRNLFPRPWLSVLIMLVMGGAVHYNTIVHPFTLADNRHYVFYVFRILMRKWWIKYAAVPAYFICACLVFGALGGGTLSSITGEDNSVRLSFALIWLASTALSLISAPLVEPRYFIVPWLVWRMYLPARDLIDGNAKEEDESKQKTKNAPAVQPNYVQVVLKLLADYSLWIELAWYLVVNAATGWMFLHRGFQWSQEPDKVQRFMW